MRKKPINESEIKVVFERDASSVNSCSLLIFDSVESTWETFKKINFNFIIIICNNPLSRKQQTTWNPSSVTEKHQSKRRSCSWRRQFQIVWKVNTKIQVFVYQMLKWLLTVPGDYCHTRLSRKKLNLSDLSL